MIAKISAVLTYILLVLCAIGGTVPDRPGWNLLGESSPNEAWMRTNSMSGDRLQDDLFIDEEVDDGMVEGTSGYEPDDESGTTATWVTESGATVWLEGSGAGRSDDDAEDDDIVIEGSAVADDEDDDDDDDEGGSGNGTIYIDVEQQDPFIIEPETMTTELAVEPPVYVETVPPPVHVKPDQRENAIPDESSMPSSQRPATPRQEDRFDDVVVTTRPPSRGDSDGQTDERQIVQTSSLLAPGILAAVVGGTVVGLLCAVLLVMFIIYRMRKKDEGSYALDEPKRSPHMNQYNKNPPKEFYA